jgi:signal transduction histidine kinase/DNA-binding response OmpR family regulator
MTDSKLVMVVDDDEALRESICELLEEDGFRTVWAESGASALSRLRSGSERPDVILLDLMMPQMNGWQFREAQLGDPGLAAIPVVVMTARRDMQRIQADAVVHKPIKLAKLLEVVGRFAAGDAGNATDSPSRPQPVTVEAKAKDIRALEASEERFRSIFETAEVSIWDEDFSRVNERLERLRAQHGPGLVGFLEGEHALVDELLCQVQIRDVNPATLRMFEATSKDELFGALGKVLPPEAKRMFASMLIAFAGGKPSFAAESTLTTLHGRRFEVAVTGSFPSGDRVLVTIMDLSARKVAERERQARAADAERAVRFSEAFVGVLGHDLRNPLSAITTAASLLEVRADSEKIARPVGRILVSAERMERMISQLLDFTRVRLGRGIPLHREPVELAEVALSVMEDLQPQYGHRIQLECVGDLAGTWDPDRLTQLLCNLTGNACQHGAAGTPVILRLEGSAADAVRIEVRNQGAIPPHLMPVIFEPLRLTRPDGRQEKREGTSGLGLGLYISQQIAVAHEGTIGVDSNEGEGTRFAVDLPRHPAHVADPAPDAADIGK